MRQDKLFPKQRKNVRGSFIFTGEMHLRDRLELVALLFDEISALLEPVLYLGPERFAPGTDWWSCVARVKHWAYAETFFFHALKNDKRVDND
jgi:hypothetical protein